MNDFRKSQKYFSDLERIKELNLPLEKLKGTTVLIIGASGLIGTYLVDMLMHLNQIGGECNIIVMSRSLEKIIEVFSPYLQNKRFKYIVHNIKEEFDIVLDDKIDYIIDLASNTHPLQYALDPVGTITTNVFGAYNIFNYAAKHKIKRILFASSNEIYGDNIKREKFKENDVGYIDCNTLRAGYPESKRCCEALAQAYISAFDLDIVIARLTRTFGPTYNKQDSKAVFQFITNGIENKNILLKSDGNQYYSYTYVHDAVSGLLAILLKGEKGEAYNIADDCCNISLKEMAEIIGRFCNVSVEKASPITEEIKGFSLCQCSIFDGTKLKKLNWKCLFSIGDGIERTVNYLRFGYKN